MFLKQNCIISKCSNHRNILKPIIAPFGIFAMHNEEMREKWISNEHPVDKQDTAYSNSEQFEIMTLLVKVLIES